MAGHEADATSAHSQAARSRTRAERIRFEAQRKAWHIIGAVVAVPILLLFRLALALAFGSVAVIVIIVGWYLSERRGTMAPPLEAVGGLAEPVGAAIRATRRSGESFPWAPVTFLLALMAVAILVSLTALSLSYAFAAYGILGFGDAASAMVGVAYGAHKLGWNSQKSWEGLGAGMLGGYVGAIALASADFAYRGTLFPASLFTIIAIAAIIGALLESLPTFQDNWTVPLGSLASMVAISRLFGL
ncbi:MAG: hypothetical protein ACYDDF_10850 [Thermoplasmatota archaeon]